MTSVNDVSTLYDTLYLLENKFKKTTAYPIHKKLDIDRDIYEYLIANYKIPSSGLILDAGCGVGFGTLKIAQSTSASVEGISVSSREIDQANENRKQINAVNCSFYTSSFTELGSDKYDLIICIESLKHAIPIDTAVSALNGGLRPGGKLIVVDDFYEDSIKRKNNRKVEQHLVKDWALERLIVLEDLPQGEIEDITKYVQMKSIMTSKMKLFGISMIRPFVSNVSNALFRGAVCLDILYKQGKMKYLIYEYSKRGDHS